MVVANVLVRMYLTRQYVNSINCLIVHLGRLKEKAQCYNQWFYNANTLEMATSKVLQPLKIKKLAAILVKFVVKKGSRVGLFVYCFCLLLFVCLLLFGVEEKWSQLADQVSTSASYKPVVVPGEEADVVPEESQSLLQQEHMYEAVEALDISE